LVFGFTDSRFFKQIFDVKDSDVKNVELKLRYDLRGKKK